MMTDQVEETKEGTRTPHLFLTQRVLEGGFWIFAIKIASRILTFIRTIIVARLLAPEDFGLMGVALLTMSVFYTFSQTGVGEALVQKRGDIEDYLSTTWILNILRGIIIFLLVFLGAPFIANFFNNFQVIPILRTMAFSPLILGFNSPKTVYFQKKFQFNKQFMVEVSATIVDILVTVTLAFILRNVWALVWGLLAGNTTRFVASYIVFPYCARFRFDINKARELLNFGKWIFGTAILTSFIMQGSNILIGKILGLAALGLYQMAYRISNLTAKEIRYVLSRVTFPAYSKIQDQLQRLREAYLRVFRLTAFISFPIAGFIFTLAPDFTKLFLGDKWMPIGVPMQILAILGLAHSLSACRRPLFKALGRPDIPMKLCVSQLIILASLIYPLTTKLNIVGGSLAVTLSTVIIFIFGEYLLARIIRCPIRIMIYSTLFAAIPTLLMVLTISVFRYFLFTQVRILEFFTLIVAGTITYIGTIMILDRLFGYNTVQALKAQLLTFYLNKRKDVKKESSNNRH